MGFTLPSSWISFHCLVLRTIWVSPFSLLCGAQMLLLWCAPNPNKQLKYLPRCFSPHQPHFALLFLPFYYYYYYYLYLFTGKKWRCPLNVIDWA